MKKYFFAFVFLLLIPLVFSMTNLDFRLDTEEKGFYPNEKIPLTITLVNRDTFSIQNSVMNVSIGNRTYIFELGTIKPSETYTKEIMLPEFPAGTHTIKGVVSYTGILGEHFTEESYGSFEVLFPPIQRYPRNIFVSEYVLPDKIIGGKSYDVGATIKNDGEIDAKLLVEFGSIEEFKSDEITLSAGQSTTLKQTIQFSNPGVQFIEIRAYALINGDKYLLNYAGKIAYVQTERKAKLSFDRLELIDEPDNEINQEDIIKLKVFIRNEGDIATNVRGELLSDMNGIAVLDSTVSYVIVASKDSSAPSDDFFEIETKKLGVGEYDLTLKLSYIDSENREKEIKIPLNVLEDNICKDFDNDGYDSKLCSDDNDNKPNEDCNDFDPNINPSIKDICDGINNDCDDKKDEDAECGYKKSCVAGACCFDADNNGVCDATISCLDTCTPDCELPKSFDWRDTDGPNRDGKNEDWMTPVKNQGSCGSCWAFSGVGTLEANYKISSKNPDYNLDLSEQQLTSNSGQCCAFCGDCDGGWPSNVFSYAKKNGIAVESCFPYVASTVQCNLCINYESNSYTLRDYGRVPANFQSIKRSLICKGPLSVTSNNWGHAITLVGYDDTTQEWIIKNSWGEWWGDHGYGKILYTGDKHSDIINGAYYVEEVGQK